MTSLILTTLPFILTFAIAAWTPVSEHLHPATAVRPRSPRRTC